MTFRQAAGTLCVACLALAPAAAHAQAFTMNFAPATQTVLPNSSVIFSSTITNISSTPLYINGDSIDPLAAGLTVDDTSFYNTFGNTPVLLGAGQTFALTNLFTVTDTAAAPGTYSGQFTVYGGTDPISEDMSGFQTFNVVVPQAVPEASTLISLGALLAGGMVMLAAQRRRVSA